MSDDDLDFRGGGLNPLNWVDRWAQYRYKDPDAPSARDVHDPHEWDNPDQSIRQRVTPDTFAGWLATGMATLILGGFTLYLVPIFASTFHNPFFLAACLFTAYSTLLVVWGRKNGFEAYRSLTKSIIYYGDDLEVRAGRDAGTDGRSKLFTPYRNLGFAALSPRPLQKRDLAHDATKLRSNHGDDGTDPAVDRLNQTTQTADTDTLGRFHVTWADDLDYDAHGAESDRYTVRPRKMDEDVARDMNELIESLETAVSTLRQQKTMLEERSSQLRQTRKEAVIPELEQTIDIMKQMYEFQPNQQQQNGQQPQTPGLNHYGNGRRSGSVLQELQKEVDEEVGGR